MPVKLLLAGMAGALAASYRRQPAEQPPALVASNADHMVLEPAPINPEWIIRGTPVARMSKHSASADEAGLTALWDCTAGEFRWYFGWDETVVIQEGEVHVTSADGNQRLLRPGDIAYFRGKTWATWRVDNYVRKVAFLRRPMPAMIAALFRVRDALRSGAAGGFGG
ncbi:cupin domain-containing protein [Pseudomonas sp. R2.Fl]|nr:cupin domain-containing protein [Pseudomonas sp. R2.Fl]